MSLADYSALVSPVRDPLDGTGGHNNVPGVAGIAFARALQGKGSPAARRRKRALAWAMLTVIVTSTAWTTISLLTR